MTTKIYKKTDRVRNTKSHEALIDAVRDITIICDELANMEIDVTVTRSQEQKYARALFDLQIGDIVMLYGKTMEEIYTLLTGIRIAHQLTKLENSENALEAA
jgi:hypothetical protein